jgi:DNA helicase-4
MSPAEGYLPLHEPELRTETGTGMSEDVVAALTDLIDAWVARDEPQLKYANGTITSTERDQMRAAAGRREDAAMSRIRHVATPEMWESLAPVIADQREDPVSRPGQTLKRFGKAGHRRGAAIAMCQSAERSLREQDRKAEQSRQDQIARAERQRQLERDEEERTARKQSEQAAAERRTREIARIHVRMQEVFQQDFLAADDWLRVEDPDALVTPGDYRRWQADFVHSWARDALHEELDPDQAVAVSTVRGDVAVTARAGSGKTRTLVTRALFLLLHCDVDPGQILLVAFNGDAADELKNRLRQKLPPGARPPHVMTFHALAYALVKADQDILLDSSDGDALAQSAKVQQIIDRYLERDDHQARVRDAMLGYFREAWDAIDRHGLLMTQEELFQIRRGLNFETLGGDFVRSYGEKLIANTLFEHGVDYKYERNFTRGGFNYRPDFTLLKEGKPALVIEYFGLLGDRQYDVVAERKRVFWSEQADVTFVELTSAELAADGATGFSQSLLGALRTAGVTATHLSDDEIWQLVRRRAVDRFSKTMKTFIDRARQRNYTEETLAAAVREHEPANESEAAFLGLAAQVYGDYLRQHSADNTDDFSGLMWRAADVIRSGGTTFVRDGGKETGDVAAFRFVMIDEFQDFSEMFYRLAEAIRSAAETVSFFCVGDDWQAINGFAGSELRYFTDFTRYFGNGQTLAIPTNYRSPTSIVKVGNMLMSGQGVEARPSRLESGTIRIVPLDGFQPTPFERSRFPGDSATPALLRLVQHELAKSADDVTVLFRRNQPPWFVGGGTRRNRPALRDYEQYVGQHFSRQDRARIKFTTAHKFKGREAGCIIVADATARSYPLIHPTWPLYRMFGDDIRTLHEAERRLFYVATTRSQRTLYYLLPADSELTPFLAGAVGVGDPGALTAPFSLAKLPSVISGTSDHLEVRVYDGYEIREHLKRFEFEYDPSTKSWWVIRPARSFDFDSVCRKLAFTETRLIEVRDEHSIVIHSRGQRRT